MFSLTENQDFFLSLLRVYLSGQLSPTQRGRASSHLREGHLQAESSCHVPGGGPTRPDARSQRARHTQTGIPILWGHIWKLL